MSNQNGSVKPQINLRHRRCLSSYGSRFKIGDIVLQASRTVVCGVVVSIRGTDYFGHRYIVRWFNKKEILLEELDGTWLVLIEDCWRDLD